MACPWHQGGKPRWWDRYCTRCTPIVRERLQVLEEQRDSYASSLRSAGEQVTRLDRKLSKANGLLLEAAEKMKRGRLWRPLSGRITAFLDGPDG